VRCHGANKITIKIKEAEECYLARSRQTR
jgi:hypothetical protein